MADDERNGVVAATIHLPASGAYLSSTGNDPVIDKSKRKLSKKEIKKLKKKLQS